MVFVCDCAALWYFLLQKELFKSAMELVEESEKSDEITTPTDPNVRMVYLLELFSIECWKYMQSCCYFGVDFTVFEIGWEFY